MPIHNDISLLHPKFARAVKRLSEYLIDAHETRRTKSRFEIFETYRDPVRQADLLRKGVSKAGPFESAHQCGLAVDFVPYLSAEEAEAWSLTMGERVLPGWNWHPSHDYRFLATAAETFKLCVPISWDPCHVEHPNWRKFRAEWRKNFD